MLTAVQKILITLFVTILVACGSNQTDLTETQLKTGISVSTKSGEFGKAASAEEIKAMSKELSSYFNGQHASNPEALMGEQTKANGGATESPKMAATNVATAVYRFFNTNTGAHFFTMSIAERDHVKATYPFFTYEGTAFFAYPEADPTLSPVYRFFNKVTGTHFFTISSAEKDHVIATWPAIFNYEGIAWHASNTAQTGWVPVYRFFNTKIGTHFYTTSAAERDDVIATFSWYSYEGIAYYVRQDDQAFELVSNGTGGFFDKTECVRDKTTGLIWQGQTPAGTGLRANNQYKTNFTSTTALQKNGDFDFVNGVFTVVAPTQAEVETVANSVGFTNAINASNLCGSTAWRMPTKDELLTIFKPNTYPAFDAVWFANTNTAGVYMSSTPYFYMGADTVKNTWGFFLATSMGPSSFIEAVGRDNSWGLGKAVVRLVR